MFRLKTLFLYCGFVSLAAAQIGYPYPGGIPGGYPGGYPPGGGIPFPGGRGPSGRPTPKGGDSNQPLPSFRGKLKHMDSKSLTLELDDYRELEFRITGKTKFVKDGQDIKSPKFTPGDQLSVEGPQDAQGNLTAVNVYWEKAAAAAADTGSVDKSKKDDGVDAWKDVPREKGSSPSTASAPAREPDDPGPPTLKRGRPAPQPETAEVPGEKTAPSPQKASAPQATAAPATPPKQLAIELPPATAPAPGPPGIGLPPGRTPGKGDDFSVDQTPLGSHQEDPLLAKATDAALNFIESLPNYICQEIMARSQTDRQPPSWYPIDVVTADLVYLDQKEDYKNIKINDKPINKPIEQIGGAWSTGEFGTILGNLFAPATQTDFRPRGEERIAGMTAKVYDYDVKRENSNWNIHVGSQTYVPAYHGAVWVDPKTGRILRIEMEARGLPKEFPSDHVETAVDYQYVRLGGTEQFLLPVHSESLSCQRGTPLCSKNTIDFRNYHKYAGESTIEFHDAK